MKKRQITDQYELLVSTEELSKFLGLSPRRVQQLIKSKVLRTRSRDTHPLFQNLRGYITHLRFLLRRYMSLYRNQLERVGRRTRFENLPYFEDMTAKISATIPVTGEDFQGEQIPEQEGV